jgi:hypothetical protein
MLQWRDKCEMLQISSVQKRDVGKASLVGMCISYVHGAATYLAFQEACEDRDSEP